MVASGLRYVRAMVLVGALVPLSRAAASEPEQRAPGADGAGVLGQGSRASPQAEAGQEHCAASSEASPSAWLRAQELFERAQAEVEAERFRDAVPLLEQAYALVPLPELLYNLAAVHAELGECGPMRQYAQRYLEQCPAGRRIGDVLVWLDSSRAACGAASNTGAQSGAGRAAAPGLSVSPETAQPAPGGPSALAAPSDAKLARAELVGGARAVDSGVTPREIAGWSLLGAGALALGGSVGLALSAEGIEREMARLRGVSVAEWERYEARGESRARFAWVLGAASAAAVGAGLWLSLGGSDTEAAAVAVDPSGAAVSYRALF